MASGNAFAAVEDTYGLKGHTTEHDEPRSTERPRLSEDAVASIQTLCVRDGTSLEVDHMILDLCAYETTRACLASRTLATSDSTSHSLANSIAMSDSFLAIFKARHPTYKPDPELRFRIKLLTLTTLFTQRLTRNPTTLWDLGLAALRLINRYRAKAFMDATGTNATTNSDNTALDSAIPLARHNLERNRAQVLHSLDIPAEDEAYEDAFYGTDACVSLLDLLPSFMRVSAARNAMSGSVLTERWMRLAGEFMLQAVLERYMVYGAAAKDAVEEAFAWGYIDGFAEKVDGSDKMDEDEQQSGNAVEPTDEEVNAMFEDDEYATEVEGWAAIKAEYLRILAGGGSDANVSDGNISPHLDTIAVSHPIVRFEKALLKFLEALASSIPEPVLVQLEKGQLDGMTREETREFAKQCGYTTFLAARR